VLIRQEDRKEISKKEFEEKFKIVDAEIKLLNKELLEKLSGEMEAKKMVEEDTTVVPSVAEPVVEKVKKERKKRVVTNFSENSQTSLMAKALGMKSVKSIDKAVETVKSWNPKLDEGKLKLVAKMIIKTTTDGKGRWKAYSWDEANFMLTPKVPK
jgi:transcriptional accessory protein Tex/SPT6